MNIYSSRWLTVGLAIMFVLLTQNQVVAQSIERDIERCNQLAFSDFEKAQLLADSIVVAAKSKGDRASEIEALLIKASIAKRQGAFKRGLKLLDLAESKLDEKDLKLQAKVLNGRGVILKYLGEFDESIQIHQKALAIREEIGDTEGEIGSYINIGNILKAKDQHEIAINYYQQAYQNARSMGDSTNWASAANNIAGALRTLERHDSALYYLDEAKTIFKATSNQNNLNKVLYSMGLVHFAKREMDKAIIYVEQSLLLSQKLGNKPSIIYNLMSLGKIYTETEKYLQAKTYLIQARTMANAIGMGDVEENILGDLQVLEERLGNYKGSLNYLKQRNAIADSLKRKAANAQIARLEDDIEKTKVRERIKRLERENELRAAEAKNAELTTLLIFVSLILTLLFAIGLAVAYRNKSAVNRQLEKRGVQLTHQKRIFEEQNEKLNVINRQLQDLNYEKNKTMEIVAHDLKSPLNSISTLTELSVGEEDRKSRELYLEKIAQTTNRASELIVRLLDVNAVESGKINPEFSTIELGEAIQSCADEFTAMADKKGINLSLDIPDETAEITSDKMMVHQIVQNLISNALKFSSNGDSVKLKAITTKDQVHISVSDTGPGIAPEEENNLFQKFKRLNALPTGGESSSGLGLYLTKQFVVQLKGEIEVQTRLGMGTSFNVTLPNHATS